MGFNEKRSDGRISYQGVPHGTLHIRLPGRRLKVMRIMDISNSGIRVELDAQVPVSAQVALEYIDGVIRVEVFGTVARIESVANDGVPGHGTRYRAGIALMSPMTLIAMIQSGNALAARDAIR